MKPFFVFILLACLVFPCFSQSAASDRFRALSEAMGRTIEYSDSKLESLNQDAGDSEGMKTYTLYRRKHESLSNAIRDSEKKIDLLIRTNDRAAKVVDERNHYEDLLNELKTAKSEYDNWLRNNR